MLTVFVSIIIWALVIVLFIAGLVATILNFPGIWLIFVGIFIAALYNGFNEISVAAVIIFGLMALLVSMVDNLIIPYSTKYTGGGNWAVLGAFVGGIVGLFVGGVVGALLGPFVGAVLFEFIFYRQGFRKSLKAGFGTFLGFFTTIILKFGAAVGMIFLFLAVWFYI